MFFRAFVAFDSGEMEGVREQLDLIPNLSCLSQWGINTMEQQAACKLLRASAIAYEHTINNHKYV